MTTLDDALDDAIGPDPATITDAIPEELTVDDRSTGRAPWSTRLPEFGVVAFALVTNLWSLSVQGWGNAYYGAAVRSMTQSWTNFFFASYDPGGWVTVDKPPLAWWLPTLSAKVFGFSSWSILWPSAAAGAVAVWLLAVTVRRVWGRAAGLVAGAALATMPTAVAVARSNNPDVWLVLGVVAAAWALERAVATGRLRWAAWMGVFVGVGFLAKLGAALIVVPPLWFAYVVASRASWRRRAVGLAVASATFAVVALVWIGATAVVPRSARPFIGGSADGTAWNLVVGYNGIGRVTGNTGNGGPGGGFGGAPPGGFGGRLPGGAGGFGGTNGVNAFGGSTGIGRLFNMGMGDQVMWLVVLASAAALGATWLLLRRRLDHRQAASLVAWGGWAATSFVVFSYASGIYHNYYVSLLAPAVAALVGIGVALVLRSALVGRLLAATALVGTAAVQLVFLRRIDALTALRVVVPAALAAGALVLVLQTIRRPGRVGTLVGLAVAAGAALLAPAAWSLSSLGHASSGSFPEARPQALESDPTGFGGGGRAGGTTPGGAPGGFGGGIDGKELSWLRTQRTTEDWILAVGSSMQASDAIINGDSVMAIGGFSGGDPTLTNARLAGLVRSGRLRFVAAGGGFGGPGGGFGGGSGITSTVSSVCTIVPAGTWGGTGTSTLYDCIGKADAIAGAPVAAPVATPAATATGQAPASGQAPGGGQAPAGQPGPGGIDLQQVQACMVAKGFTSPPAGPPNDPAMIAALKDCGLDLAAIGGPGGPPTT